MFERYIFYKNTQEKKFLSIWCFEASHEEYMKNKNILQTQEGTDWKNVISMGYLRLDIETGQLDVVPLLNRSESHVNLYLKQIEEIMTKEYLGIPKIKKVVRQDLNVLKGSFKDKER